MAKKPRYERTNSPAYYVRNNYEVSFMAKKKLTVTLHIGGEQVATLTDEQVGEMARRLSETMSRYYTANPSELKQIKGVER